MFSPESSVASSVRNALNQDLRECPEAILLQAVVRDKLLPSVKVLTDWLRANPDIITTCGEVGFSSVHSQRIFIGKPEMDSGN